MKFLSLVLLLFSFNSFCEPEVYEGELLERGGAYYKPFSTQPFTGKNIEWHKNGALKEQGNYLEGLRQGNFKTWTEGGQLNYEENYLNGKEEGLKIVYRVLDPETSIPIPEVVALCMREGESTFHDYCNTEVKMREKGFEYTGDGSNFKKGR